MQVLRDFFTTRPALQELLKDLIVWRTLIIFGCLENELFRELCKINAFDIPDSLLVRGMEFSDSIHNTFDHMWRIKKHNEAG